MNARRPALAACALLALGAGCSGGEGATEPYVHRREDWFAFRAVHPGLPEPNYLPFMVYDVPASAEPPWLRAARRLGLAAPGERRLVLCHWRPEDMPLAVRIEPPRGLDAFEDEPNPPAPARYVEAVERAVDTWQRDLAPAVRFAGAAPGAEPDLVIRLLGERAPEPIADVRVYGAAAVGDSCRVVGGDPERRLDVRYRVSDVRLYVADEHGLLLPDQVEGIALHEIGHALGMRGHSPIPADVMFEEADDTRDRRERLGLPDVNSFLALYALPSGTVYANPANAPATPRVRLLPDGAPQLDLAPHVDPRLGFELQLPDGWPREPTPYGVVAMNGVPWDYEASFQLNVHRFETIDEFVERFGPSYLVEAMLLGVHSRSVAGRHAREVELMTEHGTYEQITLIESGDGRVLVAIAECPEEYRDAYRGWFASVLGTLEVSDGARPPRGRTYGPRGVR